MARILHVLARRTPHAVSQRVAAICDAVVDEGITSRIVSLSGRRPDVDQRSHHDVHYCPSTWDNDPTFVPRFVRQLREFNPDLIHGWGDCAHAMLGVANRLAGRRPLFVTATRHFSSQWPTTPDLLITTNKLDHDSLSKKYAGRLQLVRSGLLPQDNQPTMRSLHAELDAPRDCRFIGMNAELLRSSHIEHVMWGLDLLAVVQDNVHLIIFGDGPDRQRLQNFTQQMAVGDRVHFMDEDCGDLLSQCYCIWQPSGRDANALLTAMSLGLPVVVAEGPESRDIVEDGKTGFLVPRSDSGEFARKGNILLNDAALARGLGDAAQSSVWQFGFRSMIDGYLAAWQPFLPRTAAVA